jgi:hypothetical protein
MLISGQRDPISTLPWGFISYVFSVLLPGSFPSSLYLVTQAMLGKRRSVSPESIAVFTAWAAKNAYGCRTQVP